MSDEQLKLIHSYIASFTDDVPPYKLSSNEDEITLEWNLGQRRAAIMFDSDADYGYAYFVNGKFVPGQNTGTLNEKLPEDLIEYLNSPKN